MSKRSYRSEMTVVPAGSGRRAIAVEAQGMLLAIARLSDATTTLSGGVRGLVTGFSAGSRQRLIRKMARLRPDSVKFITLTYPARFPTPEIAKNHLRALMERFRRACPGMSAIWRMEFQERGAPHFHILAFNMPFLPFQELRRVWREIIKKYFDGKGPFVRIEKIKSQRGAMYYAAKYCAKISREEADGGGGTTLFNNVTYLHAGRVWGVHNASKLPFAPKIYITILDADRRSLPECKKLMRRFWERMNKSRDKGGVIFTDHAYSLHSALIRLLIHYADPLTNGFDHVEWN